MFSFYTVLTISFLHWFFYSQSRAGSVQLSVQLVDNQSINHHRYFISALGKVRCPSCVSTRLNYPCLLAFLCLQRTSCTSLVNKTQRSSSVVSHMPRAFPLLLGEWDMISIINTRGPPGSVREPHVKQRSFPTPLKNPVLVPGYSVYKEIWLPLSSEKFLALREF